MKINRKIFPFVCHIRDWLKTFGYGYCCECHTVKLLDEMTKDPNARHQRRCKKCTKLRVLDYYRTPEGRIVFRNWQVNNAPKTRIYVRRYYQKHKHEEEFKSKNRQSVKRYYHNNLEKMREYKRKQYYKKVGRPYPYDTIGILETT